MDRVIRYEGTPGCEACFNLDRKIKHTKECRERFRKLLEADGLLEATADRVAIDEATGQAAPGTPPSISFHSSEPERVQDDPEGPPDDQVFDRAADSDDAADLFGDFDEPEGNNCPLLAPPHILPLHLIRAPPPANPLE